MNKFETEAIRRWPENTRSRSTMFGLITRKVIRDAFSSGGIHGYNSGLEDAARAIDRAMQDGWTQNVPYGWCHTDDPGFLTGRAQVFTTAELIEKYKTE